MTVVGNVKRINTHQKVTKVQVEPASTPVVVGESLIYPETIQVPTDASGAFSVSLVLGDYYFVIGSARYLVSVDDSDDTYTIDERIISAVTQAPTAPAGGAQPVASQVTRGILHVDTSYATPIAVTGIFFVADYAGVRDLANRPNNKLAWVYDREEVWRWSGASLAVDDGTDNATALKPDDTDAGDPGRWIRMAIEGGGTVTVDTFAAMLAIPTNANLKQVLIRSRTREPGAGSIYSFAWNDTTTPEEAPYNVRRSDDGRGTFFLEI